VKRTRDRGVALILALLVLVILVVVILQMTASSLHNRTVADNHLADLQNSYGARAGYARALLFLQADGEERGDVDSLTERWAQPIDFDLGRAQVRVSIVDCERFLNLSQLVNDKGEQVPAMCDQLRRLVKVLRFTPDIADRIIDYIDADSKGEFEAKAKNDRLYTMEELLRIDGITPEIVYGGLIKGEQRKGLREFLTIWPRTTGDGSGSTDPAAAAAAPSTGTTVAPTAATGMTVGQVNINTASSEVLQSLSDLMTPVMADAIVAYRSQLGTDGKPQDFNQLDDLKRVQGMSDGLFNDLNGKITVKSQTFEIRCRGTVGKVEKTWVYVVQRQGGSPSQPSSTPAATPPDPAAATPATAAPASGASTLTLIGSQLLTDFASLKPPDTER
jgi:type II secretory pathway component PulK